VDVDDGLHLSLFEHLAELRTRLIRVVLAVLSLGALSLVFARELFEFLMRPVLDALPEDSRSLIYTSSIEELNVLLKVGLYAGLFLATPVALFQLWKFVAPGLLRNERRLLAPFVTLGSLFFLLGSAFCYVAVLPSMFSFLLAPSETAIELSARVEKADALASDAGRLWLIGEGARALDLARRATEAIGKAATEGNATSDLVERFTRFERLLDAAVTRLPSAEALRLVIEQHAQARALFADRAWAEASLKLDETAALLGTASGQREAWAALWDTHKRLAHAQQNAAQASWTRPMLSMREQLSLVLVLELAFGLIFELPLLMAALALLGLLRFAWVKKAQRFAIVGCVVVAALITPTGDLINLSLMAVPMLVCFEIGALLVFVFERRRQRAEALLDAEGDVDESKVEGDRP
jgi:sec-independent protein translocase protein TatC